MKESDKKNCLNNKQSKYSGQTDRKHNKNARKILNGKKIESKSSYGVSESSTAINDLNIGSEPSEVSDDSLIQYMDDVKGLEEVSLGFKADEIVGKVHKDGLGETTRDEDGTHEQEDDLLMDQKIDEMEMRVEKLEDELRVVAALEISLYSVISEHGSSSHKVHTPARRISRLYIFACKHWTQDKLVTVAKNTVSGLVLIAKSCGNDVPRLTFWLSNIIVLREIIFQAPENSCQVGNAKRSYAKSSHLKWKRSSSGAKQADKFDFMQFDDDWQETRTLTVALEKVEAWIFSRIVESVWWQTLTPNMQSLVDGSSTDKTFGKLLGPALGDQNQGSFSINLWRIAFQEAFQRLCPVRAAGHECGCLPVLARLVMEQCVARLDVAMFNAILRESAHEIPTDPVSDPIIDPRVLPIPAGDLSFGSGAQLKNSVGNWSRLLTNLMGVVDGDDYYKDDQIENSEAKSFRLLIELSDLLMLPKSLLIDQSIRTEVCPSIGLSLIKRILCNFTPDEFCPDPVPGVVLEALNSESILEEKVSENSRSCFPCTAAGVVYTPPSSMDAAEKSGMKSGVARNASIIQRRGHTSDEELEQFNSPLTSAIPELPPSPSTVKSRDGNHGGLSLRYELLLQVWSSREIAENCSDSGSTEIM